jgi:hypothetical protein
MATTIAMLSPDGQSGEIPIANVEAAKQAGFKVAVQMKSPDGQNGYIPADRVHDAAAKGFKMVPLQAPDAVKASYWDALTNPVGSGGREQGLLGGALQVGGQAIKAAAQPLMHPIQALGGIAKLASTVGDPQALAETALRPIVEKYAEDKQQGGHALAAENLVGSQIGQIEGGRVLGAGAGKVGDIIVPSAQKLAQKSAVGLYRNALKPPPGSMTAAESTAKVQTGLDYSLPVSASGVEKLGNLVDDYNTKIAAELQKYPDRTVDPNAIAARADQTKSNFARQVNPDQDVSAIEASKQEYLRKHGAKAAKPPTYDAQGPMDFPGAPAQPAQPYSAIEAQAEKQATYGILRKKYGEQGSAVVESQKALARGAKEEIAAQFPEIDNLNKGESRLLDLGPVLERAVNRISNNHTIGIGGPIAAGGIKAMSNSTGLAAAAGVMKSIFDIPAIKSQVAIALSKGAKIPYSQALARVSAYQAALGSAVAGQPGYQSGDNSSQSSPSTR